MITSNSNIVIGGNSSVSDIAMSNEVITGAGITQIWFNSSSGAAYWTLSQGSNTLITGGSSTQLDFKSNQGSISLNGTANLTANLVGSNTGLVFLTLSKTFNIDPNIDENAIPVVSDIVPLFIMNGESNSGGQGNNTLASIVELAPRTNTKILHNGTLAFEDLDVGVNNIINHSGITNNASHGIEIGLANTIDAGRWDYSTLYIVKTGQGTSRIGQWVPGHASGYWTTALSRINAATALLDADNKTIVPIVFISLGINDILAAVSAATYKPLMVAHIAKFRALLGAETIVLITKFTSPPLIAGLDAYNAIFDEIAAEDALTFAINTDNTDAKDSYHWNYNGLKLISERILDVINGENGTLDTPVIDIPSGIYGSPQTITLTGPVGASLRYEVDGSQPTSSSPLYTAPFSFTDTGTLRVIAMQKDYKNSVEANTSYTINNGWLTWGNFTNAYQDGDFIRCNVTSGNSGGIATSTIDATLPFSLIIEWVAPSSTIHAAVISLDEDDTAYYAWDGGINHVDSVFFFSSAAYRASPGTTSTLLRTPVVPPCLMRMRGNGTDLFHEISTDSGDTWETLDTRTGLLTGKTTLYIKALFTERTLSKRIRVKFG